MHPPASRVTVEIAVDSVADALAAWQAGADRIELCARLDLDGLTPPVEVVRAVTRARHAADAGFCDEVAGLIRGVAGNHEEAAGFHGGVGGGGASDATVQARATLGGARDSLGGGGVMVMVRSVMELDAGSPGFFRCTKSEWGGLRALVRARREAGAAGVVFGYVDGHGGVDEGACAALLEECDGIERVFHRAFDTLRDPAAGLETLIRLGFTRVLTCGSRGDASAGSAAGMKGLARLVEQAAGRIQILPGGGVRAASAAAIVRGTGATQVHSSARTGGVFDPEEVRRLRAAVDAVEAKGTESTPDGSGGASRHSFAPRA